MSRRINRNLDLNAICRICLSDRKDLKPIFTGCIAQMIITCSNVKVEENDGLPSQLCVTCLHQISRYYSFKSRIEKSDAYLRKYIKQQKKNRTSIIAQAATNADIDISNESYAEEQEDESEDDMKLSVRQLRQQEKKRLARRMQTMSKLDLNGMKAEIVDDLNYAMKQFKEEDLQLVTQIFTDGPPPLVPLIPIQLDQIHDFPIDTGLQLQTLKPVEELKMLQDETPPLVPLKPVPAQTPPLVPITSLSTSLDLKFCCSSCSDEFTTPDALKSHVLAVHSNATGLICNICKKEFSDRNRLIGHLKGHMVVKHYACKLCGKRYPNPSTFRVHMRTHTGERPFKCSLCGKGFVRWAGVVGHMKSHTEHKPFKCDVCDKSFKIASNLERHKVLHTGSLPFCCSYCGKTFSQSENLQLHVRTYHTYERPYLCSECGKGFVSSTRLNRHMWVHTGYKPYTCKYCDKAYSNSNDLKIHTKTHCGGPRDEDKRYACTICNMRFFHHCRLMKHVKTHDRPYSCSHCEKTFTNDLLLNKHIVSKHGAEQVEILEQIDEQNAQLVTVSSAEGCDPIEIMHVINDGYV